MFFKVGFNISEFGIDLCESYVYFHSLPYRFNGCYIPFYMVFYKMLGFWSRTGMKTASTSIIIENRLR
jgi:hypothetical protein